MSARKSSLLPGRIPALSWTIISLLVVVLVPLSALIAKATERSGAEILTLLHSPRVQAACSLSLLASLAAATLNLFFGGIVAWVLVRYRFYGRALLDAAIDLPFALPTAVAGIALTTVYAEKGWLGAPLSALGIRVAFTPLGVILALTFVGFPFVVRSLQPVLVELDRELEEAAATLGASRWQIFRRVLVPALTPAALTGFSLAFARGLGKYGSVVFISGNLPFKTEIAPLLIMNELEQFDYSAAAAIGALLVFASLLLLLAQARLAAHQERR